MIWCVEDDASIRDIEVYALQSTGLEAKGFEDGSSFWEALGRLQKLYGRRIHAESCECSQHNRCNLSLA